MPLAKVHILLACAARLIALSFLLARHLLSFAARLILAPRGGRLRRTGESLASLFEDLGPAYVKIGQVLSCRPDLLPPDIVAPLARLQDNVRPVKAKYIRAELEAAFGCSVEEIFSEFESRPIASASVAQVHWAIAGGREVAVKIRRPGVVSAVATDFRILRGCARALAKLPFLRAVPLVELVEEIRVPIEMQLDFREEAENNRKLRAGLAHAEHIRIPALVEPLCKHSVLTMEFLPGLRKLTSPDLDPRQRKRAAIAGLRALYKMIFIHGFVHADMHPANIFLNEAGELVILDMGLMARLSPADRRNFVDFFFGLVNNRGAECAAIVLAMAPYCRPACDRAAFERAMVELIARHSALKSREFEVTRFVYELIETQRRFGIRGSTSFVLTVLSMVVYDGICKQLYPECDFQSEARPFLLVGRYGVRDDGAAVPPLALVNGRELAASSRGSGAAAI